VNANSGNRKGMMVSCYVERETPDDWFELVCAFPSAGGPYAQQIIHRTSDV